MRSRWLVTSLLACAFAATVWAQEEAPTPRPPAPRPPAAKPATAEKPAAKPAPAPPPPVEVHASVSKTAVWVGDQVTYLVVLRCAPTVDIVSDDLAVERLRVDGVEVKDVTIDRDATEPDHLTYRVAYRLVSYRIDATNLTVAEIPVRYSIKTPGQAAGSAAAPAGEVKVPALSLVMRSALPDSEVPVVARDGRPVAPVPQRVRLAQPVGLGLIMLSVAPVAVWLIELVRRSRRSRVKGEKKLTKRQRRASLDEIKALDTSSVEARRDAYAHLDGWIREHARSATGVTAVALTPSELSQAVPHPGRAVHLDQIQALLTECERAKYAPQPPENSRWSEAVHEAEQLLGAEA